MGQDKFQRIAPFTWRADGFDKIVACARGDYAQRRARVPEAGGRFGERAVAAEGDHGFRPAPGGLARQLRGMPGVVGQVLCKVAAASSPMRNARPLPATGLMTSSITAIRSSLEKLLF